jgi:hypothetical protein
MEKEENEIDNITFAHHTGPEAFRRWSEVTHLKSTHYPISDST